MRAQRFATLLKNELASPKSNATFIQWDHGQSLFRQNDWLRRENFIFFLPKVEKRCSFYFRASHIWETHIPAISLLKKLYCFKENQTTFPKEQSAIGCLHLIAQWTWGGKNFLREYWWNKYAAKNRFFCNITKGFKKELNITHGRHNFESGFGESFQENIANIMLIFSADCWEEYRKQQRLSCKNHKLNELAARKP